MEVNGHTFLISGGASGLGAASAQTLAGARGNVLLADLNREAGERLAGELGPRARFQTTDVTDEASVRAAVQAAVQHFGVLHGSVQCAGIAIAERILGKAG